MKEMQPVTILLVEDDDAHSTLIERHLRRAGIVNPIVRLVNGREALDFLFNKGRFTNQLRPQSLLMLLDLNMPEVDGFQVIQEMKKDEECRIIPVIVLTTTDDPHEIQRCYELGCNNFITKPVDPLTFSKTIQAMGILISLMSYPCCQ